MKRYLIGAAFINGPIASAASVNANSRTPADRCDATAAASCPRGDLTKCQVGVLQKPDDTVNFHRGQVLAFHRCFTGVSSDQAFKRITEAASAA